MSTPIENDPPLKRYKLGGTTLKALFPIRTDEDGQPCVHLVIKSRAKVLHDQAIPELNVGPSRNAGIMCVDCDADHVLICPINPLSPDVRLRVDDLPPEVIEIIRAEWDRD